MYSITKKSETLYCFKLFGYSISLTTHFIARYNQRNIIKDCSYDKSEVDLSIYDDSMFQEIIQQFIEKITYIRIDNNDNKETKKRFIGCDEGLICGSYDEEKKRMCFYTFIPTQILTEKKQNKYSHLISDECKSFYGVSIIKSESEKRKELFNLILNTNTKLNKELSKYNEMKNELSEFGANIVINIVNDIKQTFNEEIANEFGVYLIRKLQK